MRLTMTTNSAQNELVESSLGASAGEPRLIQSVDRAIALLKAVAASPHPPTALELARTCGLNRSTSWRLLGTLEHHGLVERHPATQRYSVGYGAILVAGGADHDSLVRRARAILQRLAAETGETVSLAVPKRMDLVYVDQIEGSRQVRMRVPSELMRRPSTSVWQAQRR
jgi:DNA-binding IclR family transcriptional regulator